MKMIAWVVFFLGLLNFHQATAKNTSSGLRFPSERLVFHQESRGLSFLLKNNDQNAYLVQADIAIPDESTGLNVKKESVIPFMITPPLYRLEAKSEYSWQIKKIDNLKKLPQDRESVFFVRLKAIPPKGTKNTVSFKKMDGDLTLSKVLHYKFYYRPETIKNLKMANVKDKFKFTVSDGKLIVDNQSPLYLTFGKIAVGQHQIDNMQLFKLVPPFSKQSYPLPKGNYANAIVSWRLLNEFMLEMPEQTQKL
ncbi:MULTISPECIES: fimbrial biogenesis chaperone [Providencia]|uniref:PapD pilus/flagellar-assembly chaperone N-terminal domain protein n=1 Tax=Providencia alcalifaciens 205/92 TaxID=1256988 RepID=A0AAV3M203_9GAMM|nr:MULTISPECIES: molecular chaperone [Providencia]ETT08390.1 PapD pilus/flagellar-assembly chaperone N-terminal domain protein [Providencia alcalifaciens F90-2004]EUC97070.1 PapD pilus/flagellar-assembly chaperone N-terminal domain protein [Providencia alcalifaciens PAL-2]EUD09838.1 PapD pilus/flagellar-assembly chaperone N-terminal domain protein [Providencia alcalifaciens 205/92]MTB31837.1 fimbria/pilus periplasmic chaperone [Providencia alcalifaciens]MTC15863.1 fimbria/pilus periplasmic cha